ncbi:MAG TPA: hypothetical protein V6D08_14655 [Candidatus Obscuribacterales bacterium]
MNDKHTSLLLREPPSQASDSPKGDSATNTEALLARIRELERQVKVNKHVLEQYRIHIEHLHHIVDKAVSALEKLVNIVLPEDRTGSHSQCGSPRADKRQRHH